MTTIDDMSAATAPGEIDGERVRERRKSLPGGIRRFFRFNLMALLIALLVVAIYFGVRQRFAVSREENLAKRQLWDLHASYTLKPADPVWVQYALLQFGEEAQHVDSVKFPPYYPDVNDVREAKRLTAKDLALLARLPHLRKVDLSQTIFDEPALGALMHNGELEELILSETLAGDDGLQRLANHPTLSIVRLDRTLTSDASLKTLAELPALREITLDDATTAEGIEALTSAKNLTKVDASLTALLPAELEPLTKRHLDLSIASPHWLPGHPASDEESFWYAARYDGAKWVRAEDRHLTDPSYLARLEETPNVSVVNVHHDGPIDPEDLSSLLALPQVLEIYLDLRGAPIPYSRIEAVANRSRPDDARPCIVYGNVSITGEELVYEGRKVRDDWLRQFNPTGALLYAPYVIHDLRPEHVVRLNELAESTRVRVQPHAPKSPADWGWQSSLLSELSPVFVQIPIP